MFCIEQLEVRDSAQSWWLCYDLIFIGFNWISFWLISSALAFKYKGLWVKS